MPTPAKGLTQPVVGGDNNIWGNLLNTNISLIDNALGGTVVKSISGNTTLSDTDIQNVGYYFTGTLTGNAIITWPSFAGMAAIHNGTTGGFFIICNAGGSPVTVLNGETVAILSDGTNFTRLSQVGGGTGTTGSGEVVLQNSPNIASPTLTGTTTAYQLWLSPSLTITGSWSPALTALYSAPILSGSASISTVQALAQGYVQPSLYINIPQDSVNATAISGNPVDVQGFTINRTLGGGSAIGSRTTLGINTRISSNLGGSSGNDFYSGILSSLYADSNVGGTDSSHTVGNLYGTGIQAALSANCTHWTGFHGIEVAVSRQTGSSVTDSAGIAIVSYFDDNASSVLRNNAGLWITSTSTSHGPGFTNGILIGGVGRPPPIPTTGIAIKVDNTGAAIATGLDFTGVASISGNLLQGPNGFSISGRGLIESWNNLTGNYPASSGVGTGFAIGTNFTNGGTEVDFFNTANGSGGFTFYQKTGALSVHPLFSMTDVGPTFTSGYASGQVLHFMNGGNTGSTDGAALWFQGAGSTVAGVGMESAMVGGGFNVDLYLTSLANVDLVPGSGHYVYIGNYANLQPVPGPSSPLSGWYLFVDSGDGNKLKAIASTGTVVIIGTP